MMKWKWAALAVALLLVLPGLPRHYGVPPLVDVAGATSCFERTIKFKKENSTSGIDQYKGEEHVFFCVNDARTKVKSWSVRMSITYTGAGWEVSGSDSEGYWKPMNGHDHYARVEWRQKTLKFCPGIGPINACLKSKHPAMTVQMKANGQLLIYDVNDMKITQIVCNSPCSAP